MRQASLSRLGSGVLVTLWGIASLFNLADRSLVLMAWPLAMVVCTAAVIAAASGLHTVWPRREPIARAWRARGLALAVIASVSVAAIGAMTPSLAIYGDGPAIEPISSLFGPLFLAGIAVCAVRVLLEPSPRRLGTLAVAGVSAWPFLTAMGTLCEMGGTYGVVDQGLMWMFSLGTMATSGLVLACGLLAWRAAAIPALPAARAIRAR
jgi:hypothetical protein